MRDHVLFEFGLFTGALGRAKTHLLLPRTDKFLVPTDLVGVAALVEYTDAALGESVERIRGSIVDYWQRRDRAHALVNARERAVRFLRFVSWLAAKLQGISAALSLRPQFDAVMNSIEAAADMFLPAS